MFLPSVTVLFALVSHDTMATWIVMVSREHLNFVSCVYTDEGLVPKYLLFYM